jgi:hypothetical protein
MQIDLGDGRSHAFLKATRIDLQRLLDIVDKYPNRNWDWLLNWVDGDRFVRSASVDVVISLYEDESIWADYGN